MADGPKKIGKPRDWEKAVSVAYLRSIDYTQKEAAEAAGVGERTIQHWEKQPWFGEAIMEAHSRWLAGVATGARRGILRAFKDPEEYARTARWAAERVFPELAPPKQRVGVTGKDDGPIEFSYARETVDGLLSGISTAIQKAKDPSELE